MHLRERFFTLIAMMQILYCYCNGAVKRDTNIKSTVLEKKLHRRSNKNDDDIFTSKVLPKSCYQCGKSGMQNNGHCILYDQNFKTYLAYCDFSSEPGFAWTLAMSLARDVILYESSKLLKKKIISENCSLNEDSPNWYAFRINSQRMRAMRTESTHFRFTCSQNGAFVKLINYNDYVRVNLAQLDPFTLDDRNGKCTAAEFVNIRTLGVKGETTFDVADRWLQKLKGIGDVREILATGFVPRSCVDCGLLGMKDNGYCTIQDDNFNKFIAYCDFTSEPGYAWTLVMSYSRHIVQSEGSQMLKRKSLRDNVAVNENMPNWYSFRYGKYRMKNLKFVTTHLRLTCSEYGPFVSLYSHNDYARLNFSSLDPFTLDAPREKCIATEFIKIRNHACNDCKVAFLQRRDAWSLHIDSALNTICGFADTTKGAAKGEDNFGFYDRYNPQFTCTKYPWSTTQLWFGSILLPPALKKKC